MASVAEFIYRLYKRSPAQSVGTNYVLIDYENVQPTSFDGLDASHFKVILFMGASQNKLPLNVAAALQKLGTRAQYLQSSANGPNALDFHIAFYIGHLSSQDPTAYFHIISKDTGFDPLIQHLRQQNLRAHRFTAIEEIPLIARIAKRTIPAQVLRSEKQSLASQPAPAKSLPVKPPPAKSEHFSEIVKIAVISLKRRSQSKPKTLKALSNTLASEFRSKLAPEEIDRLLAELQRRNLISVDQSKITYDLTNAPY